MYLKGTFLLTLTLKLISAQSVFPNWNNCKPRLTCSECIQQIGCLWCISPSSENHCVHENETGPNWCAKSLVVNPKFSLETVRDKPLTSTVQIRPQRLKVTMRKGEEFTLPFQFAQPSNYPVDLYYIMDLSASMEEHREQLAELGNKLVGTLRNITSNFRIGFGIFVSPDSYTNYMSLTMDHERFTRAVAQVNVSGNLGASEGGFVALMQALVCRHVIGWRERAKPLIVFSTAAEFLTSDGKRVLEPNDGYCHMMGSSYTHDPNIDYPSVGQINHVAKQYNINIIFAVVNKTTVVESYSKLSQRIENSELGVLNGRSDEIIRLVMENYQKIRGSVIFRDNSTDDLRVHISSTCAHPQPNGCTNIRLGEIVDFTATITALECTKGSKPTPFMIYPVGLLDSIVIDLEVPCECDCESPSSAFYKPKSDECSSQGTLRCGICRCDDAYFGKNCECSWTGSQTSADTCKINKNDTRLCSGLGYCMCGRCHCNQRSNFDEKIFGKYCECDNYSCKRVNGEPCSGRGTCGCGGICTCQDGWTGDACQCPDSNPACGG